MKNVFFLGIALMTSAAAVSLPRLPQHEMAFYTMDKSPDRTSRVLKEGWLRFDVSGEVGAAEYTLHTTYSLKTTMAGTQDGDIETRVPVRFFEPEFIDELAAAGSLRMPKFSIRYLGPQTAIMRSGKVLRDCAVVELYDIDTNVGLRAEMTKLAVRLGAAAARPTVRDLAIRAVVCPGVPVLGAVRADLSGKTMGMPIKAGFDYLP